MHRGVDADVKVGRVAPVGACVALVVVGALSVHGEDVAAHLGLALLRQDVHLLPEPGFKRGVDEHAQDVGAVAQEIVRAAADDYAAFAVSQLLYYLRLIGEEVYVAGEFVGIGRDELAGVNLARGVEKLPAVDVLIRGAEERLAYAAAVAGQAYKLVVVKAYAQPVCCELAYAVAAGAVLSGNGDNIVVCHFSPPFCVVTRRDRRGVPCRRAVGPARSRTWISCRSPAHRPCRRWRGPSWRSARRAGWLCRRRAGPLSWRIFP